MVAGDRGYGNGLASNTDLPMIGSAANEQNRQEAYRLFRRDGHEEGCGAILRRDQIQALDLGVRARIGPGPVKQSNFVST